MTADGRPGFVAVVCRFSFEKDFPVPTSQQIAELKAKLQNVIFEKEPNDTVAVLTAQGNRIGLMQRCVAIKLTADARFSESFALQDNALVIFPNNKTSDPQALSEAFDRVARPLHDAGYFVQWRDELLSVFDLDSGKCIALAERGLFRFLGMLTTSVYAVGTRRDGRVFVSLRSRTKQVDPGLWDALAAGMISANESRETAVEREIAEEAGLTCGYTIDSGWTCLKVRRTVPEGWMAEDAYVCRVVVDDDAHPKNVDGEVEEIRCVCKDELFTMIKHGQTPVDTGLVFLNSLFEDFVP